MRKTEKEKREELLNIGKKTAFTLFALTILVSSLLLANLNIPAHAQATDPMYLHGPPLQPIHMHSDITLKPIHMHLIGPPGGPNVLFPGDPRLEEPNSTTDWHELYPVYSEEWHLSSWEDLGDPFFQLSPNDQIDMTNLFGEVQWFHVDRMTITLILSGPFQAPSHEPSEPRMALELKWPHYDPYIITDPILFNLTMWHEVWPTYSNHYTLNKWVDDPVTPDGQLSFTDSVSFDGGANWYHVEDVATDLILRWKMMDPIGTRWHELYPTYSRWYNLTSWESYPDPYCDRISPRDTIDMVEEISQVKSWYFVDRVTITINVTDIQTDDWMMLELKTAYFEEMYYYIKHPLGSFWHEVYPVYSNVYNLTYWDLMDPVWDNCNGVLDPSDHIVLVNQSDGLDAVYHITDMAYDIILNEYITDPVSTDWTELYPTYGEEWHISEFADNGDLWLSPSDNLTLLDPTGFPGEYHVENVTLTLNVTILDIAGVGGPPFTIGETLYLENVENLVNPWNYSWPRLYHPKIEPLGTDWTLVHPSDYFDTRYTLDFWDDNCNGVIDYCDDIQLSTVDQSLFVHVDGLAVDIIVEKTAEPEPWYKKPSYPDYAPSGMPDFDQKQDAWHPPLQAGHWTWCGPVAAANSIWWFDSKYDPSNIVTAYPGIPDDHDVRNVDPFVKDLAWWMDTDGQRTGFIHTGTFWQDMVYGIDGYLKQQGENDTLEVHFMEFPNFTWIEGEVRRSQDVVLLLEFWQQSLIDPNDWDRIVVPYDLPGGEGGHYVTSAGVKSTFELQIADPWWDAAENGWPGQVLPAFPHPAQHPSLHNDTLYVSHDAYNVAQWIEPPLSPYPGSGVWELVGYLQQLGWGPAFHAFIRVAIATSPIAAEDHDVAVIDMVTSKTGCLPAETVGQGYTIDINATVENQGGFTETFNVTLYGNATVIGSQNVPSLNPGDNRTLMFTWDTTGWTKGNYSISAYAWPVPLETDLADNNMTYGWVFVTIPGDVDGDRDVDIFDIVRMAGAYGTRRGDPKYDPNADLDDDGDVDIFDIVIAAGNYGKSW